MEKEKWLQELFASEGFELTEGQIEQLLHFYSLLIEKNEVMNLTAVTEYEDACVKHFLDSCMLWKYVDGDTFPCQDGALKMIDVGTGAGFPGIPLKIVRPEIQLHLLDALQKRIDFLHEVCEALPLERVSLEHDRAEDGARMHREAFDLAVSRAVSRLSVLAEYCLPFVKVGGAFVSYKSGKIEEELREAENAISVLGGKLEAVRSFTLPDGAERSLIFIRKVTPTPAKYPRKAGKAAKSPL